MVAKSPCCSSGKLENVENNTLNLVCSKCGTIYDLVESNDFKKALSIEPLEVIENEVESEGDGNMCSHCGENSDGCDCNASRTHNCNFDTCDLDEDDNCRLFEAGN